MPSQALCPRIVLTRELESQRTGCGEAFYPSWVPWFLCPPLGASASADGHVRLDQGEITVEVQHESGRARGHLASRPNEIRSCRWWAARPIQICALPPLRDTHEVDRYRPIPGVDRVIWCSSCVGRQT